MSTEQEPASKQEFLVISDKRVSHKIPFTEVVLIESKGMISKIHTSSGANYTCSKNLGALCKELAGAEMIYRLHTSYAINLNNIIKVNKQKKAIIMSNGFMVPIAKARKSEFFKRYMPVHPAL